VEFIPFFSFVYHEYVTAFGESVSMDIDYSASFYNQMARTFARNFVQGEIMKAPGTTSDKRQQELFDLFKNTAQATSSYANKYLIAGRPLVSPEIDVPIRKIDWYHWFTNQLGTPIFEPAILHSAWLSDDNSLGIVFVNWDKNTIAFDVELPNYDYFVGEYSIVLTRNGQQTVVSYNTTLPVSVPITMNQNDVILIEAVKTIDNLSPNKPIISGPTTGKINTEYTFSFVATDPEGNNISYFIDWGDGTNSEWSSRYPSGEIYAAAHSWAQKDMFEIRAKARDDFGLESKWSDPYPISMPKSVWVVDLFCQRVNQWFLILFGREIIPI
jgi:hypothetical protein